MAVEIPNNPEALPTSELRWLGRAVNRVEDPKLVTGRTEFIDDVNLPGMLHCAILRSPFAHARIERIDTSEAEKLPGVVVLTGEDALRWTAVSFTCPEGWGTRCLATDKVRFVGEPVAAVAAASRYEAEDALERIIVDYEPILPVVDPVVAQDSGEPLVFEERGTNVMFQQKFVWGDVEGAFREADHVYSESFRWNRLGANPLETAGVITQWDLMDESLTCRGAFQSPLMGARGLATNLGLSSNKVRVTSHPHGGSFGGKGGGRGTTITALLSRKSGGRPVKWIEDRMEYLTAGGGQAWDRHYKASLAVNGDGIATALHIELLDNIGATGEGFGAVSAAKPLSCFTGCYAIPVASYDLTLVATNKLPTSAYRGMGPPPHNFVLEQMMDIAARDLGIDPAEIRRRNYIPPDAFPYTIPSGNEYDSGDYEAALDGVLEMADYQKLRREQEEARSQGRCVGIGVVNAIEPGVFDWNAYNIVGMRGTGVPEGATVSVDLWGKFTVRVGFALEGQGQYTLACQIVADYFSAELSDVNVVYLDTLSAPPAFGPGGSRLGVALSGALMGACAKLVAKLAKAAAVLLESEREAVEFFDGMFRVKGAPAEGLPLAQVVGVMLSRSDLMPPDVDPHPEATHVWTAPGRTVPDDQGRAKSYLTAANACHLVLVEIDPETGQVEILDYFLVDDCGTRLNPATVEGQTQGSLVQGVGAALLEEYVYDEDGQNLTTTFMDYLLPTIYDAPMAKKGVQVTLSPFSPLGAKGCGEGAIHTTPAAVMSAINDALAPLGARATEVPATPQRLWTLIHGAETPSTDASEMRRGER
ncbi:MAG: xanthine dehydrogenase family protein molybdopterin-binding subunit [Deltaproteobacteria bacterium]|nr:xanthine dehydrogenase family protein molybdopterin-binding subunit [Deltaproteobacteria bacterium]MBW2362594.1 xanthine dehydrogenase family protein molybdopterin-binding subunit [Deltaproteobacteria bacterium]